MPTHRGARVRTLILALLLASPAAAVAATISWGAPQAETGGNADIFTKGTLFAAVTDGQSTIVGGINFIGRSTAILSSNVAFGSAPITVSGLQTAYTTSYSLPPPGFSGQYLSLIGGGGYSATSAPAPVITISDLQIGTNYTIQVFEASWEVNYQTMFTAGGATSAAVANSGYLLTPLATPQFILGSFTASATTQTISLTSATGYVIFDALQVRTELPEPGSLPLLLAGLIGGHLLLRRPPIRVGRPARRCAAQNQTIGLVKAELHPKCAPAGNNLTQARPHRPESPPWKPPSWKSSPKAC